MGTLVGAHVRDPHDIAFTTGVFRLASYLELLLKFLSYFTALYVALDCGSVTLAYIYGSPGAYQVI
jgi:hypothetical protein